ncbi:MAG: Kiwa anti-phage protein KwaB-like domain-containing protein [Candidatus Thiodiazotropha endolucinida]
MTIENLKEEISSVISSKGCSAEFYFLLDGVDGMKVKSVDINDDDQVELSSAFIESISNNVLLNDDLTLVSISSADDRKDAIYEYDLENVPAELTHLKAIIENDQFDAFSFDDDSLSHLEGILVLIGNQDKQLAIYKYHYPITLLKKDSGFSLMRARGANRFQKLDQDILKIDSNFQFIKISGKYYIRDLKTLERFFGNRPAITSSQPPPSYAVAVH